MDLSFLNPMNFTPAQDNVTTPQNATTGFGWLDTLRSDPIAKKAMVVAGLQMLNAQPGESALNQISRGALSGIDFYDRQNVANRQAQMQMLKDQADLAQKAEQLKTSQINNATLGEQNTEELRGKKVENDKRALDLVQAEKKFDTVFAKLKAEQKEAELKNESDEIKNKNLKRQQAVLEKLVQQHPELEVKAAQAELELPTLKLNSERALANERNAAANLRSTQAKGAAEENEQAELLTEGMKALTPRERLAKNTGGNVSAQEANIAAQMENWEILNPKPTDAAKAQKWQIKRAQFNQGLRENLNNAKINQVSAAKEVLLNAELFSPEEVANAKAILAQSKVTPQAGAGENPTARYKIVKDPKTGKNVIQQIYASDIPE